MDKKQGVPIIGGKKEQPQGIQMQELIPAIVAQLKPTLDLILGNVTALEGRMAVVEEVKQLFPSKIDVIVKQEQPQIISHDLEGVIVQLIKDRVGHVLKEKK